MNQRLLPIVRAATRSAMTQAGRVPKLQTPRSSKEDPRFHNTNQSTIPKDHSTITPPAIQSRKPCPGVPCSAAGTEVEMSLVIAQNAAGTPRPKIRNCNQHRSRLDDALAEIGRASCRERVE